jgi:hypothetical protein
VKNQKLSRQGSVFVGDLWGWWFRDWNGVVWEGGGGFEVMECGDRAGYKGEGVGGNPTKTEPPGLSFCWRIVGVIVLRWD